MATEPVHHVVYLGCPSIHWYSLCLLT